MSKSENLSPLEVLIYNRIKWLTENGSYKFCNAGNSSLSVYFNRPKESISRTISKLKRLGYVREEKDGTMRKLFSTNKKNIYNYGVNIDDEIVICNDEIVNIDDKVVMLKALLNEEVVIDAMRKSLTNDEEVVKHNIIMNIRRLNKGLETEKPKNDNVLEFNQFWDLYPRRIDKQKAFKSFLVALKKTSIEKIMIGVKYYIEYIAKENTEQKFIKHPSTWLNNACWTEEYKSDNKFQSPDPTKSLMNEFNLLSEKCKDNF